MTVFYPPHDLPTNNKINLFLAGSIELGNAIDWQNKVINDLNNYDINILNPRRLDFDSSQEQSINNDYFYKQVTWELNGLDIADIIIYYFDPNGKAPITLYELGLHSKSNKTMLICCPDGFWRKGNIEIISERFNIPLFKDHSDFIKALKNALDYLLLKNNLT